MGTLGIARDMAKRNEENLSKLSGGNLYDKLKNATYKTRRKKYLFKKSNPKLLKGIKDQLIEENQRAKRKRIILITSLAAVSIVTIILMMNLTF